ncbi:MAG: BON domain-containing protein [bacterium]|nr:BON domain-containing protein [bacterium]
MRSSSLSRLAVAGIVALVAIGCGDREPTTTAATDTARNTRDAGGGTVTPLDQSESAADRETTRRIREALVENDALSTNAKNVKVVTVEGAVTVRGPVNSPAEKATVVALAQKVAGPAKVVDQLEVAAP